MKKNYFSLAATLLCSLLFVACGNQKPKSNWMADDDVRAVSYTHLTLPTNSRV